MQNSFSYQLLDLQPSQLYINMDKLTAVQHQFALNHILEPLPVKKLASKIVLTDGHTRAFAAFLRGETSLLVYWDNDPLDWAAYEVCVQWCLDVNIHTVADFATRIIGTDAYQKLWLDRCRVLHSL